MACAGGVQSRPLHHAALGSTLGQRLDLAAITANCLAEEALQQTHPAGRTSLHLALLEEATQRWRQRGRRVDKGVPDANGALNGLLLRLLLEPLPLLQLQAALGIAMVLLRGHKLQARPRCEQIGQPAAVLGVIHRRPTCKHPCSGKVSRGQCT